ncbi:hypothetical protein OR1_01802 [Geobacter sp. OR-1]|uniref:hypothetical protein n=1 Tax=Geobacter sp. OR-1 TaxID=1266765 RepID=UPI0005436267|nr:hypothetical protein [Geobacter sp. OR-1]GAM09523.1 hypothetical protein OR1_01802 [Geobacter sp. OR-1]
MANPDTWGIAVDVATTEFRALDPALSESIARIIRDVMRTKQELTAIFDGLNGGEICMRCGGECCRTGCYHFTAVDLLAYLVTGEMLFSPRFDNASCPFLGAAGCLMAPEYRPYNCVTFICDRVDVGMDSLTRDRFAALSADLLALYQKIEALFANRFVYGILNNGSRFKAGRSAGILWSGNGNDKRSCIGSCR